MASIQSANGRLASASPVRSVLAGVLMGLANLVPGVSGGTMILICGVYDQFIAAVADAARLRFRLKGVILLAVIGGAAGMAILLLSGQIAHLVRAHPSVMYGLFIGLTLGAAPLLVRSGRPLSTSWGICVAAGLALMLALGLTEHFSAGAPDSTPGTVVSADSPWHTHLRDALCGLFGMGAMVLPGVSGAYVLVLLGRYEAILDAISMFREYAFSAGRQGDLSFVRVLVPVAAGAAVSLVGFTNLLKWLLQRYHRLSVGVLLGILIGSAAVLAVRVRPTTQGQWTATLAFLLLGFVASLAISRLGLTDRGPSATGKS